MRNEVIANKVAHQDPVVNDTLQVIRERKTILCHTHTNKLIEASTTSLLEVDLMCVPMNALHTNIIVISQMELPKLHIHSWAQYQQEQQEQEQEQQQQRLIGHGLSWQWRIPATLNKTEERKENKCPRQGCTHTYSQCTHFRSREFKVQVLSEQWQMKQVERCLLSRRRAVLGLSAKYHLLTQQGKMWLVWHHAEHDLHNRSEQNLNGTVWCRGAPTRSVRTRSSKLATAELYDEEKGIDKIQSRGHASYPATSGTLGNSKALQKGVYMRILWSNLKCTRTCCLLSCKYQHTVFWFQPDKTSPTHQISIKTIQAMAGVGIVVRSRLFMSNEIHDFVLSFSRYLKAE